MMKIAVCLLAALAPACAQAEMRGVWEGTIGRNKVMVCLGGEELYGTYYYRRHLGLIPLAPAGKAGEWNEEPGGQISGHWQLKQEAEGVLAGSWRKPGDPSIPIRLERPAGGDTSCGGDAFNAPLESKPVVVRSVSEHGGHRYASLYTDGGKPDIGHFSAVQLLEKSKAADAINAALRGGFPADKAGMYQCRRDALENLGIVGESSMEQEILFWNRRLLAVRIDSVENCGGAHPNDGPSYRTWDTATGAELDSSYWFKSASEGELPAQVKRLVLARAQGNKGPDQGCAGQLENQGFYKVYPTEKALVFFPDFIFASRNCNENIAVPYGEILKFLTPEAKAALGK